MVRCHDSTRHSIGGIAKEYIGIPTVFINPQAFHGTKMAQSDAVNVEIIWLFAI
jgi:hypothetical protein